MSLTVISLGESDSMSNELARLGLKGSDSLFEGVVSGEFKDVLAVLTMVADGNDIPITLRDDFPGNKFLADTHIRTCLYENVDFDAIIKGRVLQLKADLVSGNRIVFVREDTPDTVTNEDIDVFVGLVKKIAPECVSKLVIFSRSEDNIDLVNDVVVRTKFNADTNKDVILRCFEGFVPVVAPVEAPAEAPVEAPAEAPVEAPAEAPAPVAE